MNRQSPDTLRNSLAQALDDGPFSVALRLAIQASGLSLDRLQRRLDGRGISVSRTTLSYWQSGRTQPERPESVRAVRLLEDVLDVPEGALTGLLGPPRPRGRWSAHPAAQAPRPDRTWARPEGVLRVLAQVGAAPEHLAHLLQRRRSVQERLDAHRQVRTLTMQMVVESRRPQVRRALIVHHFHMAGVRGPVIEDARGWRAGRVRSDHETGFEVHEMILDRPLAMGERAVVEYTLAYPPGHLEPHSRHRVEPGTRELSVEVTFDRAALPARCRSFFQPSIAHPKVTAEDLWIGSCTAALIVFDPEPGLHGVDWEWE
ncbi:hypothetical protein ACH35V_39795 [Actinomadura sp. 1N219]|uniref:hypothetical protein n=1 Tax=Actinomadura sp. 1N219 TaxID=3375152 RepID=UPI0037953D52